MDKTAVERIEPPVRLLPAYRVRASNTPQALKKTIQLVGQAIKSGSQYPPIRAYAASIATRAAPKDYLGQVKALFDDFTKHRWRYVRDPVGLEVVAGTGEAIWSQVLGAHARPGERGYGDCDESTAGLGAALMAIGFPIRMVTTGRPGAPKRSLFTHIFPQAFVPKRGWISVDAVGYPQHGIGWTPPHGKIAYWDLDGKLQRVVGNFPKEFSQMLGNSDNLIFTGGPMETHWQDYGLENAGLAGFSGDTAPFEDWDQAGLLGFGAYIDDMGYIDGDRVPNLVAEYDDDDMIPVQGMGMVRTRMLEMAPQDFQHMTRYGVPRAGSVALSDDGEVYQWMPGDGVGGLGFFKKLFRKIKRGVRKGVRFVRKKARSLIRKLPGGKYIVKLLGKVRKVAMKLVRPLARLIGPVAKRLAPIAAIIPGYGTAVAAALYGAGKVADVINKAGVIIDRATGIPKFKSGKQAAFFKKLLTKEAKKMKRSGKKRIKREIAKVRSRRTGRRYKLGTRAHRARLRGLGADVPEIGGYWN